MEPERTGNSHYFCRAEPLPLEIRWPKVPGGDVRRESPPSRRKSLAHTRSHAPRGGCPPEEITPPLSGRYTRADSAAAFPLSSRSGSTARGPRVSPRPPLPQSLRLFSPCLVQAIKSHRARLFSGPQMPKVLTGVRKKRAEECCDFLAPLGTALSTSTIKGTLRFKRFTVGPELSEGFQPLGERLTPKHALSYYFMKTSL